MKKIYVAGGCFWGVEAFFKLIPGIKNTRVGYANSIKVDPTYEEVCSGVTNAVEAVELLYNPKVITLKEIVAFLFRIIDPTSKNKQGGDIGTQYRTGIYFSEEADGFLIAEEYKRYTKNYDRPIVTEILPLQNFYDAEHYHQDYLSKNPGGYCHVNLFELKESERKVNKPKRYHELLEKAQYTFTDKSHTISVLSNLSALIKEVFPKVSWVGFYFDNGKQLIVGPFQGKVACETIAYTRGVCGAAYRGEEVIIVPDVHDFPGHISCDDGSNSEIVLPFYDCDGILVGVLDLDSYDFDYFDQDDAHYLTILLKEIAKYIKRDELLGGIK